MFPEEPEGAIHRRGPRMALVVSGERGKGLRLRRCLPVRDGSECRKQPREQYQRNHAAARRYIGSLCEWTETDACPSST